MPDFIYLDLIAAAKGAHKAFMRNEYWAADTYLKALRDDLLSQARARYPK